MIQVKNFLENVDVKVIARKGCFSVVEFARISASLPEKRLWHIIAMQSATPCLKAGA